MPFLSAIIITKNEARNIAACLETLRFCDEVIVVDSGSSDETMAIAAAHGAKVSSHPWQGFGKQKNAALALATGDWVLSIDADERVSDGLRAEIISAIATNECAAYRFPCLASYLGRPMYHSGWYPNPILRLFKRDAGRFTDDVVHERIVVDGKIGRLKSDLIHHSVLRIEDTIGKMDRYSTAGAEKVLARGKKVSFFTGIGRGLFAFIRTYLLQLGFLDGREGFILAVANAEGTYYRYMKAWFAQQSGKK